MYVTISNPTEDTWEVNLFEKNVQFNYVESFDTREAAEDAAKDLAGQLGCEYVLDGPDEEEPVNAPTETLKAAQKKLEELRVRASKKTEK